MKYLAFVLCFASSSLFSQNVIKLTDLIFPVQIWGLASTVTVGVNDAGAATFTATGTPGATAEIRVTKNSVNIDNGIAGNNNKIEIDAFTINNETPVFDVTGQITNIRVGARATITAVKNEGEYTGSAKLRLTYY